MWHAMCMGRGAERMQIPCQCHANARIAGHTVAHSAIGGPQCGRGSLPASLPPIWRTVPNWHLGHPGHWVPSGGPTSPHINPVALWASERPFWPILARGWMAARPLTRPRGYSAVRDTAVGRCSRAWSSRWCSQSPHDSGLHPRAPQPWHRLHPHRPDLEHHWGRPSAGDPIQLDGSRSCTRPGWWCAADLAVPRPPLALRRAGLG